MAEARAFPYLRYDPDVVGDPGKLLAPPYDVVDEVARAELAAGSPYQSIHVELPEGGDAERSAALLREWIDSGVLEAGEEGVAVVRQRFVGPDGVRRTRTAVCCEVGLHEFSEAVVLPHERTFDAPRRARAELMRITKANISPVLLAYHDSERSLVDLFVTVTDEQPDFTAVDADGTQTAVWFVTDVALCEAFEQALEPHQLLIADGHHRYTAALAWQAEARAAAPALNVVGGSDYDGAPVTSSSGANGVLAVLCNSADPGIMVFPTHRILEGVPLRQLDEFVLGSGAFDARGCASVAEAMELLQQLEVPGFVVHHRSGTRLFSLADPDDLKIADPGASDAKRSLDVVALHDLVIDGGALLGSTASRIAYTRSLDEAMALVDEGDDRIGLLMRAAPVEAIHAVAAGGELLPQKSTYFYPKVPTGVAFRPLDPLA